MMHCVVQVLLLWAVDLFDLYYTTICSKKEVHLLAQTMDLVDVQYETSLKLRTSASVVLASDAKVTCNFLWDYEATSEKKRFTSRIYLGIIFGIGEVASH